MNDRNYVLKSILFTILILVIMFLVAVFTPKKYKWIVLILLLVLAFAWTIITMKGFAKIIKGLDEIAPDKMDAENEKNETINK